MTGDELIYVEPRQDAVLQCDGVTVACRSVPEAWLYWAQTDWPQVTRVGPCRTLG